MDNARWKEKLLNTFEIAKDFYSETEIRKASRRKELFCPDLDCKNPSLKYCHGDIKDAYFSHLINEHCDYSRFDKQNTQIIRNIRRIIYNQFKSKGFQVQTEVKVLDHHYTHLLFDMNNGVKIAVEIGTKRKTANEIVTLLASYRKKGIEVKWIVIDDTAKEVKENQTYFMKRFLFNESKNKDLLVVDSKGKEVAQYKADLNHYEFHGRTIIFDEYTETYVERVPIDELTIEDNELTITGFKDRYNDWLLKKSVVFKKTISHLEEDYNFRVEEKKHDNSHREAKWDDYNINQSLHNSYEQTIMDRLNKVFKQAKQQKNEK